MIILYSTSFSTNYKTFNIFNLDSLYIFDKLLTENIRWYVTHHSFHKYTDSDLHLGVCLIVYLTSYLGVSYMSQSLLKKTLTSAVAASAMVAFTSCKTSGDKKSGGDGSAVGQCHGVNKCKGQGKCGGKGHDCAGKNSCKGKGWEKITKEECDKKGGKFKAK